MNSAWYACQDENITGPWTLEELQDFLRKGELTDRDQVVFVPASQWQSPARALASQAFAPSEIERNPFAPPETSQLLQPARGSEDFDEDVQAAAAVLLKEKQDFETCGTLLTAGIIPCLAPVAVIYGIVFLWTRPREFPGRGRAIVGTVLCGIWTAIILAFVVAYYLVDRAYTYGNY